MKSDKHKKKYRRTMPRCRSTTGKKARCLRRALSGSHYCQAHKLMHRIDSSTGLVRDLVISSAMAPWEAKRDALRRLKALIPEIKTALPVPSFFGTLEINLPSEITIVMENEGSFDIMFPAMGFHHCMAVERHRVECIMYKTAYARAVQDPAWLNAISAMVHVYDRYFPDVNVRDVVYKHNTGVVWEVPLVQVVRKAMSKVSQ